MFSTIDIQLETVLILAAAGLLFQHFLRRHQPMAAPRTISAEDDLYEMARITGASEYDIFRASAADWTVSESMVEKHFKDYLKYQATPYYVNAVLRKHKQQVDTLNLPPF